MSSTSTEPGREPDDDIEDDLYGDEGPPSGSAIRAPDWTVQVVKGESSVFELHRQHKHQRLDLKPLFQRGFIWKQHQQVRLIESVLARIPLPAIYLSDEAEDLSMVIDGQQRLTTLFRFLDGKFALKGMKLLPRFEGKTFPELEPRFQRRIEDTKLTVFSIQPGSDPTVKFYLFERINQGGISLNAQEIRNGIYRGAGLEMVQRLSAPGGPFRDVAGEQRAYARMKADELVLRALAFQELGLDEYPGDMEPFLNDALVLLNAAGPEKLGKVEESFLHTLGKVDAVFGRDAFRRHDVDTGTWGRHLNAAVMDLQLWGFRQVPRQREFWVERKAAVIDALGVLHRTPEFRDSITFATSTASRVRYRLLSWKQALEDVARNHA